MLTVDIASAPGAGAAPPAEELRAWAEAAYAAAAEGAGAASLALKIVDEAESEALNRRYRGVGRPTNVLSFPGAAAVPAGEPRPLGDIAICGPVVAREAAEQARPETAHWCHMVVHGTLHLLGYAHDTDTAAAAMETLETRLLADFGFRDPYCEG
ncbi:MAG: rRNA maturation RNase YbeY [Pseudomonadota bacterium]